MHIGTVFAFLFVLNVKMEPVAYRYLYSAWNFAFSDIQQPKPTKYSRLQLHGSGAEQFFSFSLF